MAAQYQIPGGTYINETDNNDYQVYGDVYLNETSSSAPYRPLMGVGT